MAIPISMNTYRQQAYRVPDLRPLLAPRAIAIVGASDRPGAGPNVLGNLEKRLDLPGQVYPVNPKYAELGGWRCYPSLADLPGPVDTVAILLGYKHVLPTLQPARPPSATRQPGRWRAALARRGRTAKPHRPSWSASPGRS